MIPQEVADMADTLAKFEKIERNQAIKIATIIYNDMRRKGWTFQQKGEQGFRTT